MPTTRVLITKDGKVVAEGIGYVGDECTRDLQRLIEALKSYGVNVEVTEQQKKPEAYAQREGVAADA